MHLSSNAEKLQVTQIRNNGYTTPSQDPMMQEAIDGLVRKGIVEETQKDGNTIYVFTNEGNAQFG